MARIVIGEWLLPLAFAVIAAWWTRTVMLPQVAARYGASIPFAVAYVVGYIALPDFAPLVPSRHWHWLFYLVPLACGLSALNLLEGVRPWERAAWHGLLVCGAACCLVPTWETLRPARGGWMTIFALNAGGLILTLNAVVSRSARPPVSAGTPVAAKSRDSLADFSFFLLITSLVVAGLIGAFVSLTLARVAGLGVLASASVLLARIFLGNTGDLRGIMPAFVVATCGMSLAGCLDPRTPLLGLLVTPWAPAMMGLTPWFERWGMSQRTARRVAMVCFGVVLGATIALVYRAMRTPPPVPSELPDFF